MDITITCHDNMFRSYTDNETFEKIIDFDSVSAMWENCVASYGKMEAIVDADHHYSFSDLEQDAGNVRGFLLSSGVTRGQRVGVLLPNCYDFVRSYLGIVTMGATAVLLPPQLDENAVFGISYMLGIKTLISCAAFEEKTSLASTRLGVSVVDVSSIVDSYSPAVKVAKEEPCVVLFTGGTTGKSKGALLSNGAVMRGTKNGCYGYDTVFHQRYLEVLPLTHVFGLVRNLMTSLYTGSSMLICRNNKDMFRDCAMFRPTILVMVPALAEMALNLSKQFKRNMLGDSVRYIICGAATVPPYLAKEYHAIGVTLLAGYGLTESANLVSGNPETFTNPTSVGYPYPGQELRIVDGELWLKGDNMMDGYVGNDAENQAAYTDGWFRTGDLVHLDENGFLYITGRTKEILVLPTGENISPAELEQKFDDLECVQDSLVYLDQDAQGKEILALQVYPRHVVLNQVDAEDKNAYLMAEINRVNHGLPPFQRVSKVTIRETDFVRSGAMKILRDKN